MILAVLDSNNYFYFRELKTSFTENNVSEELSMLMMLQWFFTKLWLTFSLSHFKGDHFQYPKYNTSTKKKKLNYVILVIKDCN